MKLLRAGCKETKEITCLLEKFQLFGKECERLSVVRGNAEQADAVPVLGRGIADIGFPSVAGEFFCELVHQFIAIGFRKYRRCRNGQIFPIAFYDALILEVLVGIETISVNEQ